MRNQSTQKTGCSAFMYYCFCYLLCCCRSKKSHSGAAAETRLLEERFNLFTAYDLLSDAIIVAEIDGKGDKHKIKYLNRAAIILTGYTRDEAIGKPPGLLMPEAIAKNHNTYIAKWKMKTTSKGHEYSKSGSKSSEEKSTDEHGQQRPIISTELDMTKGQVRGVSLKTKQGEEIPVYIRLNIFADKQKVYAVATLREQHIIAHINFEDTLFHLVDKETGSHGELSSSISHKNQHSTLDDVSDEEEEKKALIGQPVNIYINPPHSFADFSDISKWIFQPENLREEQRKRYVKIIRDRFLNCLDETVKCRHVIISYLKKPGLALSGDEVQSIKTEALTKFNAIENFREPTLKCLLTLSSRKDERTLDLVTPQSFVV